MTYTHSVGTRQSKDNVKVERFFDEELFDGELKLRRPNWDAQRRRNLWEQLKADPETPRQFNGPPDSPSNFHLRLGFLVM